MSLNRREFLKFSAGVSAAASSLSGGALQGAANGGEKHVHSFCEMCSSRCPIEAKVVDDKKWQSKSWWHSNLSLCKGWLRLKSAL